jgi:hypothetical protein
MSEFHKTMEERELEHFSMENKHIRALEEFHAAASKIMALADEGLVEEWEEHLGGSAYPDHWPSFESQAYDIFLWLENAKNRLTTEDNLNNETVKIEADGITPVSAERVEQIQAILSDVPRKKLEEEIKERLNSHNALSVLNTALYETCQLLEERNSESASDSVRASTHYKEVETALEKAHELTEKLQELLDNIPRTFKVKFEVTLTCETEVEASDEGDAEEEVRMMIDNIARSFDHEDGDVFVIEQEFAQALKVEEI